MATFEFTTTESPGMVHPEEYLDYLIIERTAELEAKVVGHNAEYKKIQAELEECYQEIQGLIQEPDRGEPVIDRLRVTIGVLEVMIERLAFKQGLKDGAALVKLL